MTTIGKLSYVAALANNFEHFMENMKCFHAEQQVKVPAGGLSSLSEDSTYTKSTRKCLLNSVITYVKMKLGFLLQR